MSEKDEKLNSRRRLRKGGLARRRCGLMSTLPPVATRLSPKTRREDIGW